MILDNLSKAGSELALRVTPLILADEAIGFYRGNGIEISRSVKMYQQCECPRERLQRPRYRVRVHCYRASSPKYTDVLLSFYLIPDCRPCRHACLFGKDSHSASFG